MKVFIGIIMAAVVIIGFRPEKTQLSQNDINGKQKAMVFCAPSFDPSKMKEGKAPFFKGLGKLNYSITTNNKKVQQYFNQGLNLLYSFNHNEAGRSFYSILALDSTNAMAYWGMGMVLGPNYNAALNPTSLNEINDVMDKAVKYSDKVSPKEKALIRALARRFPRQPVDDMAPYNAAYAAGMKEAYDQFPNDVEIAALYIDALMNEHPWNLWLKDGTPQPWTPLIAATLEKNLEKYPAHPGLNHMYIHAMEASQEPNKALPAADRLSQMLPSAGHMVHMPSHVYIRTGHYHKGVVANEKAVLADSSYVAQCKVQGFYALLLYPHNIHFLAACAFLEGNSKKAIDAAWMVSRKADRSFIDKNVTVQHYFSIPFYVMVHMAKWDDILKLDQPPADMKYPNALWHYARGEAFTAKKDIVNAKKELAAIEEIKKDPALANMRIWENNSALDLIQLAAWVLKAEILAAEKNYKEAIKLLREAVEKETSFTYQEPPDWFFSVRHTLGHILLQASQYAEAEKVYLEDLRTYPENGWALMGLYQSLKNQDRSQEANEVKQRFNTAWQWSDIKITSSRLY